MTFAQLNAKRIREEQRIEVLRLLAQAADQTYAATIKAVERLHGTIGVQAVVAEAKAITDGAR